MYNRKTNNRLFVVDKSTNFSTKGIKMGLGDFVEEAEKAATGQGGQDGDNNANNANGSNDKTEDTMVDTGESLSLFYVTADVFSQGDDIITASMININHQLTI
jgi:hypothetical protein